MYPKSTQASTKRKRDGTTAMMFYEKTNASAKTRREKARLRKQKQRKKELKKNVKIKKKKTNKK